MNKTNIEWADYTWNPITGCTPISAGCDNCYARELTNTRYKDQWGDFETVRFHPERLKQPMKVIKPSNVFVCSMSDFFHEKVLLKWQTNIMQIILNNPQHNFLILTKRPQNIQDPNVYSIYSDTNKFPDNLWLGISVEDNTEKALFRSHEFTHIDNCFISFEPLIDGIELKNISAMLYIYKFKWVIVGGETGRNKRPIKKEWVDNIYKTCNDLNVPFFFKKGVKEYEKPEFRQYPKELIHDI